MFDDSEQGVRTALQGYPEDPSGLTDEEAASGFAQLQRISELVEAKRLRWLADQDRRASYGRDGYLSTAAWLSDRFRVAPGPAKRQVQVAQTLEQMPHVRGSFVNGEVSSSAVLLLAEAQREHPEAFSAGEEALVDAAKGKHIEELRRVLTEWVQAIDEHCPDRAELLRERRRLDVCPGPSRMVHVRGDLDPESGETLLTALQSIVDADLRASPRSDLRTGAQRRADALCELARRFLDSPERPTIGGERPHVTVTIDADSLRRGERAKNADRVNGSELDHIGPSDLKLARRLACDASVTRVVLAGPSEPLEVGRKTPVVPAAIRRAVIMRDRRCRFPSCTRPHPWCDAHHVVHWADGGETAVQNLVLLCRPHHRLLHEGGFRLQLLDGRPIFRRPDGSILEDRRVPP